MWISVDASGLAKSSALLFGPLLAWAVLAAVVPGSTWVGGICIGAGLVASLLLGRTLVRGSRQRGVRLLDVRAEVRT